MLASKRFVYVMKNDDVPPRYYTRSRFRCPRPSRMNVVRLAALRQDYAA